MLKGQLMTSQDEIALLQNLLYEAQNREAKTVAMTQQLVKMESPSQVKMAVDHVVASAAELCASLGGKTRLHEHSLHGNSLEARFGHHLTSSPVLLLGHLDTVWDLGTLQHMPWKVEGDRLHGPGVLDMKLGVAMALEAIALLQDLDALTRPVVLLLHGDEEIGSPASRPLTEGVAKECSAVYVLEPAQGEAGAYKTSRKGVGHYRLKVRGIAAHSGVDFGAGHSAILELGRQLGKLAALTNPDRGITVNPGVIGGGTRSNVIAEEAWAEIDVRIVHSQDANALTRELSLLKADDTGCTISVTGGINRPPMERTAAAELFCRAKGFAAQLGLALEEAATGGGSDGNFTAALGIPTLDGMGAVGAGAHAAHEHALRSHIAPRTALLAAMLR